MSKPPTPTPNRTLSEALDKSGYRRNFVAAQIGVSKSLLSHWEAGRRTPSQVDREKLALLLRRGAEEFVVHETEVSTLTRAPHSGVGNDDLDAAA